MSVELMMLLYSTLLLLVVILAQAGLAIMQNGLMAQAGSRDSLPEPSVVRLRLQRLTANLQENLIMFAAVILIANAAGVSNTTTALGASIFLYARIAHAIVYALGWPVIRPLFYFASLYGLITIVLELLKS
ncbi:MAPEG family protein [Halieaceae bacterium IMCC14734]|uniref:MAPEG family protein n=1 Tax=Candidatus Litorirhabdus singularis TaxID=2518993 RepID=A0ABT3TDZ2_9GAMM|nr:MAPEG family protein [Candidatus Litorirhabdus singularis]MCX2980528.1 MAPEG family protein [Candidatus Litorirhabdus singularis]